MSGKNGQHMRKKRTIIFTVLLVLLLMFIWGHSMMPADTSREESGWVLELLRPALDALFGKGFTTHHFVRKLAHFTEFAVLGILTQFLLWSLRPDPDSAQQKAATHVPGWLISIVISIGFGFFAAFLDETIQMFSDRGDQISDVWLDVSGAAFGCLIGRAAVWLLDRVLKGGRRD